jgi:hypothetical protein
LRIAIIILRDGLGRDFRALVGRLYFTADMGIILVIFTLLSGLLLEIGYWGFNIIWLDGG